MDSNGRTDDLTKYDLGQPIKVRLVLDDGNKGWIIGKFAERLAEHLPHWNVEVDISASPSADADINHWMIYHYPWVFYENYTGKRLSKSTMAITHVDDPLKFKMLQDVLGEVVDIGICMSRMAAEELVRRGIARNQLCYITPAHDGAVVPRRVVIGITSRVYPDHRKREDLLIKLAQAMRLDAFHFEIIGRGWESVIPLLESAGATVRHDAETGDYQRDYALLLERIPAFDYYLYTGLDEGSMGLLDALAAGAGTIVTPQGFHLDIPEGITHPFWEASQLLTIFESIAEKRQHRIDRVKHLTWNEYARQHAIVWRRLLDGRHDELPTLLSEKPEDDASALERSRLDAFLAKVKYYANMRRSYFWPQFRHRFFRRYIPRSIRCLVGRCIMILQCLISRARSASGRLRRAFSASRSRRGRT